MKYICSPIQTEQNYPITLLSYYFILSSLYYELHTSRYLCVCIHSYLSSFSSLLFLIVLFCFVDDIYTLHHSLLYLLLEAFLFQSVLLLPNNISLLATLLFSSTFTLTFTSSSYLHSFICLMATSILFLSSSIYLPLS